MAVLVQVDAIVFLVDSADPTRFFEARKELNALLSEDYLAQVCPTSWLFMGSLICDFHHVISDSHRSGLRS
jgi:hypothetical protein